MKYVVVNADDMGIAESTNTAILSAHLEGIVTSTSLLATGPAFEYAVSLLRSTGTSLGVGIHLNLTSGQSISIASEIPLLTDSSGQFRNGFLALARAATIVGSHRFLEQVEAEFRAQFHRLTNAGLRPTHVDSHRHIHMIPAFFEICCRLAREFGCGWIRMSRESWAPFFRQIPKHPIRILPNIPKNVVLSHLASRVSPKPFGLRTADSVVGIMESGHIDAILLATAVSRHANGVLEIITHPGMSTERIDLQLAKGDRRFFCSPNRRKELEALCASQTLQLRSYPDTRFTNYSQMSVDLENECQAESIPRD